MSKYVDYMNSKDGLRKIYTREKIGKMSQTEFSEHEKEIDNQMKEIGVPTKSELDNYDPYIQYVWLTSQDGDVCEECQSLDGTTYSNINEIPDKPHPNCRCYIELIEVEKQES